MCRFENKITVFGDIEVTLKLLVDTLVKLYEIEEKVKLKQSVKKYQKIYNLKYTLNIKS